jgi:hypothetical protein
MEQAGMKLGFWIECSSGHLKYKISTDAASLINPVRKSVAIIRLIGSLLYALKTLAHLYPNDVACSP